MVFRHTHSGGSPPREHGLALLWFADTRGAQDWSRPGTRRPGRCHDRIRHPSSPGRPTEAPRFFAVLTDLLPEFRSDETHYDQCIMVRPLSSHPVKVSPPVATPTWMDECYLYLRGTLPEEIPDCRLHLFLAFVAAHEQDPDRLSHFFVVSHLVIVLLTAVLLRQGAHPSNGIGIVIFGQTVGANLIQQPFRLVQPAFACKLMHQRLKQLQSVRIAISFL